MHFDALAQGLADADLVIVATGAPHIVLHESDLRDAMARRVERPLVVIDLAVPRNVDPAARALADVRLYDMDDLSAAVVTHHPIAAPAIAAVEEIVAQEVAEFIAWWRDRQIAPLIIALRSQAEEIRQAELTKTLERLNLTPEHRQALDTLVSSLTNKLLYASIRAIKGVPSEQCPSAPRFDSVRTLNAIL